MVETAAVSGVPTPRTPAAGSTPSTYTSPIGVDAAPGRAWGPSGWIFVQWKPRTPVRARPCGRRGRSRPGSNQGWAISARRPARSSRPCSGCQAKALALTAEERLLVLARHEGPQPHTGRQPVSWPRLRRVRRFGPGVGRVDAAHLQQHPPPDQAEPPGDRTGGRQVAVGPDRTLPVQRRGAPAAVPMPTSAHRRLDDHLRRIVADRHRDADRLGCAGHGPARIQPIHRPPRPAGVTSPPTRRQRHPARARTSRRRRRPPQRGRPDRGYRAPGLHPSAMPPGRERRGRRHAGVPADSSRSTVLDGGTIL